MSVIYVLVARGGAYDYKWKENIVASVDKTKIELKLKEEEAEIEALKVWQQKRIDFLEQWKVDNPEPELIDPQPTHINYPRWTNLRQSEITQEMRDARAAIMKENERALAEWNAPVTEWRNRYYEIDAKFIADAGRTLDDTYYGAIDVAYSIEEIPQI